MAPTALISRVALRRIALVAALLMAGPLSAQTPAQTHVPKVDVFHWWVSGGERASVDVIRDFVLAKGVAWSDASAAGSGTDRYTKVLAQRVQAGRTPTAAQMIGYDIHAWARRGLLQNLDALAEREEWDAVVPLDIQHLSKYEGHWVAAPFTNHATNWLWVNGPLAQRLGVKAPPDTFSDLIALLDQARTLGVIPLAMGKEAWEQTLLFESVAAGALGAAIYRRAFIDLDASALPMDKTTAVFARMRLLSTYMDPGYRQRSWDQATDLVRTGKAFMQAQGTWVNGEFTARGMQPDSHYDCWRFPDTQGLFLFNADQYIFFRKPAAEQSAQNTLASLLMSPSLQAAVNIRTGAAPARVDVSPQSFNTCGKRAIADLRASNMRRTVLGSIAMGNANPAYAKTAIYQVVAEHLSGALSDAQAATALHKALQNGARTRASQSPSLP